MQTTEPGKEPKKPIPGVDDEFLDMLDPDKIEFKPITKGLGFHHGEENKRVAVTRKRAKSLNEVVESEKKALTAMANQAAEQMRGTRPTNSFQTDSLETADLKSSPEFAEIYGKPEVDISPKVEKEEKLEQEVAASMAMRFMAWIFDLVFVAGVIAGLLIFSRLIGKYDIFEFFGPQNYDNLILLGTIYGAFYVIYFSIFEAVGGQTLGKKIFGMRVKNQLNAEMKFSQTFKRANLSLFSLFALGLPVVMGTIDKVTDTKVVKK